MQDAYEAQNDNLSRKNKRKGSHLIGILTGVVLSFALGLTLLGVIILLIGASWLLDRSQRSDKQQQRWKTYKGLLTCTRSGVGLMVPPKLLPKRAEDVNSVRLNQQKR